MFRAALALALAFGLAQGNHAEAAPPGKATTPPENPFQEQSDQDSRAEAPGSEAAGAPKTDEDAEEDEDEDVAVGDPEAESVLHALTCLEGDAVGGGRRKGVQKRDFLKRHRFELSGLGGFYASDTLSSTYSYGGSLAFYPSEDFGIELLVTRSPVNFRLEEPFSAFDRSRHFLPGNAWQGILSLLWSPIHAKLRFSDDTIIHGDIFFVAGAGKTVHDSVQGLTWEAGAGIKLYPSRYFTFRIDVRDFLLPQEVLGRGRITNNVTILGGVSLWLPG